MRRTKGLREESRFLRPFLENKGLDLETDAMHSRTPLKPAFIAGNQACMRIGCQFA